MIALEDLLTTTTAHLVGPAPVHAFTGFCYDSRRARPGELFLALKTEKADGHDFITAAVAAGVTGILCERPPDPPPPGVTCLVVPDTRAALQSWAAHILRRYGTRVIGVTGSAGKTVTKEAIAAVLDGPYRVFKNPGNYNDLLGLPIALGQLRPEHQIAVLEMASDRFGEIEALCRLAPPQVGVVTSIGPAHLAYFGSLEAIAGEKAHLIWALPDDGVAVLNADDPLVRGMRPLSGARVIQYGRDHGADVHTGRVQVRPDGLSFLVHAAGARGRFELRLLGRHHVYAALAAVAVGLAYDLRLDDIAARLKTLEPLPGRLRPLPGLAGSVILDDTYSASLPSVLAALELLERFDQGRRIVVLGDLLELDDLDVARQVGSRVARVADLLVTKGVQAESIAFAARRAGLALGQVFVTYTAPEAARVVSEHLAPGVTVLVKGDRQARMEQVVGRLLAEPGRAEAVLVRQDPAWTGRWPGAPILYPEERPTWIEVDLEAIAHNCERIKALVGPAVAVLAVLKANAYGHGLVPVARTVLRHGATMLGVAALNEAEALRQADIAAPIMILGYTPAWQARTVARLGLTVAVYSLDVAQALSRAATALHRPVKVHVKVDSGMGRLGLLPDQVLDFLHAIHDLPGLEIEGIFTHFATADDADRTYLHRQLDTFQAVLRQVQAAGFSFRHIHAANSAATLTLPASHFTLVRPGLALYGLQPSDAVRLPPDFRPALSFKTRIAQVKELPAGHCVSYGCTFWTTRPTIVAVLPVGYADGFRRAPVNWGQVLIQGRRVPLIGRVCMDQCMADVTDLPGVRQGDEAVLIGAQGNDRLTAEEVAARLGTINYEVVSGLLVRVPRMY